MNKNLETSLFIEDPDIVTGIGVWTSSLNPKKSLYHVKSWVKMLNK